ncbi:MAG: chitobiase/beta-hexosaminidase C-terminal domain-containing protein [Planctomycetes bacterium]|nr:chitobiase/beta-hexosaminidase C-terminal domain-containing protein [Planctomycetota bacterium]
MRPIALLVLCCLLRTLSAADHYLAPSGAADGDGTIGNPWNISVVGWPGQVAPGDTLWLRGGTYNVDWTAEPDMLWWNTPGTAAKPVTVRNQTGERAIIDLDFRMVMLGNHTHFIGVEFMCSRPSKVVASGWDPAKPADIGVSGTGVKIINCVLHDLSFISAFKEAVDYECYGNVMYYIGAMGDFDRPFGTTGYLQNDTGTKIIEDNLMLNNVMHGLQIYGSDAADMKNIRVVGNTIMEPGILSGYAGFNAVVWVGERAAENIVLTDNICYQSMPGAGSNVVLWGSGGVLNKNLTVTGNHIIGGSPVLRFGQWDPVTVTGNTLSGDNGLLWYEAALPSGRQYDWNRNRYHYQGSQPPFRLGAADQDFAGWKQATGLDAQSTYSSQRPSAQHISVRPNRYEAGRAHITVYNPALLATASIDLSNCGLGIGQSYRIVDGADFFGSAIHSGTYDGNPVTISLPGKGAPVARIIGDDNPRNFIPSVDHHDGLKLPVHGDGTCNAFVLLPGAGSTPTPTVAKPVISPDGGSFSSAVTVSLSSATDGAQICYTLDGSTPTSASTLYSGAFTMSATTTLRVRAFKSGMNPSPIGSATFTLPSSPANVTLTALPAVVAPGGGVEILWTAPSGRPATDWAALYADGSPIGSEAWWNYTDGAAQGSRRLTAPAQPGRYEVRYYFDDGSAWNANPVMATASFTVTEVTDTPTPPGTTDASSDAGGSGKRCGFGAGLAVMALMLAMSSRGRGPARAVAWPASHSACAPRGRVRW